MDACTVLGHPWRRTAEQFIGPDTYECERCEREVDAYGRPPRWPWFFGYPLDP